MMTTEIKSGGFQVTTNKDGSGHIDRFVGYLGEYRVCKFGPGQEHETADDFLTTFYDEESQIAAAERRCSQM